MKLDERVLGGVRQARDIPVAVGVDILQAWEVAVSQPAARRLAAELGQFVYLLSSPDRAGVQKRADKFRAAAEALRAALDGFGPDIEEMLARDLAGADDPWLPLCTELRRIEIALARICGSLPEQSDTKGRSLVRHLAEVLAPHYQCAAGHDPKSSTRSRFAQGVMIAHDALPLGWQEQNMGLPPERWSQRTEDLGGRVRVAVRAMQNGGSLAEHYANRRYVDGAVEWIEARPAEKSALLRLHALGGFGAIERDLLEGLQKAGLVKEFGHFGPGLTALAEHALGRLGVSLSGPE